MRDRIASTTNWHLRDHSSRPAPRVTRGGSHRRQPHPALRRLPRAPSISTSQERTSYVRGRISHRRIDCVLPQRGWPALLFTADDSKLRAPRVSHGAHHNAGNRILLWPKPSANRVDGRKVNAIFPQKTKDIENGSDRCPLNAPYESRAECGTRTYESRTVRHSRY
jgi:hypothetical protein